jgi:nucleoside-diphosphate-sugar epimerase
MRTPPNAIIGASGFIGAHLMVSLANDNRPLNVLRRRTSWRPSANIDAKVVDGDLEDRRSLEALIEPGSIVFNLARPSLSSSNNWPRMAQALAEACKARGARRLVHCGTAAVSGRARGRVVTEETVCQPASDYECAQMAFENTLTDNIGSVDLVLARPTAVFGPAGRNLLSMAHRVLRGSTLKNRLVSSLNGDREMHLVSVHTVAAALRFLRQESVSPGVYIISCPDPLNRYKPLETFLAEHLGRPRHRPSGFALPLAFRSLVQRLRGLDPADPCRLYDDGKLTRAGFISPVDLHDAIAEFAKWFRTTKAS